MNTTRIPTQKEYHDREMRETWRRLEEINAAPVNERRENAKTFSEDCTDYPALIVERIRWLLDGSYGYGPMVAARRAMLNHNPKPDLFVYIANFEWLTGDYYARQVWKILDQETREKINRLLDAMLTAWKEDQRE